MAITGRCRNVIIIQPDRYQQPAAPRVAALLPRHPACQRQSDRGNLSTGH